MTELALRQNVNDLKGVLSEQNGTNGGSFGGNGGRRLGDVQMAAGVAELDPRRRLARGTRNGNRGRLSRSQYRFEPLDCGFVPRPLLGSHYHVKAVGLVDVVDEGGRMLTEPRPMASHRSYVRRLDRRHSGICERCGGENGLIL